MTRALLIDLDGVIRHWDARDTLAIEERHGLPAGSIAAVAFAPALLERAVQGRIADGAWRDAVRESLVGAYGPAAAAAVAAWSRLGGRIDGEVVALVADLRDRGGRAALVSNATTRLEDDLASAGLDRLFDAVVSSARVGLIKPDARLFRLAAGRLGCAPESCVFVDDTPGHVEAARRLGMTAILFTGAADLRARLAL